MVTEYIEKGRLTDAFLDDLGMPRAPGQEEGEKDDLADYRWRSAWLNNKAVILKLNARKVEKALAVQHAEEERQRKETMKQSKDATAPLEKKYKELVARLVAYRDAAETSWSECKNSVKDARTTSSTGLSSCKIQEQNAMDGKTKTHGIWRGAYDEGKKTCTRLAGEGKVEDLKLHLNSYLALESTAKDAAASAASAAASAKQYALLPAAALVPKSTAKRGKKGKLSKADLLKQIEKMQKLAEEMSTEDSDDGDPRPAKKQTPPSAQGPETRGDDDDDDADYGVPETDDDE